MSALSLAAASAFHVDASSGPLHEEGLALQWARRDWIPSLGAHHPQLSRPCSRNRASDERFFGLQLVAQPEEAKSHVWDIAKLRFLDQSHEIWDSEG